MNPQCQNCGKIVALKAGITTELQVKEEFLKDRPDAPEKIYLCITCGNNPEILERYKRAPWYAGHRIIQQRSYRERQKEVKVEEKRCGQPYGTWCIKAYESILPLEDACRKIQKEEPRYCEDFKDKQRSEAER